MIRCAILRKSVGEIKYQSYSLRIWRHLTFQFENTREESGELLQALNPVEAYLNSLEYVRLS